MEERLPVEGEVRGMMTGMSRAEDDVTEGGIRKLLVRIQIRESALLHKIAQQQKLLDEQKG